MYSYDWGATCIDDCVGATCIAMTGDWRLWGATCIAMTGDCGGQHV